MRGRGLHFGAGFLFVQNQLQQHHQQQQEQQQQQQAQQLQSLNPEGSRKDVSLRAACFWRLFRPSVAWCFGVARGTLWKPAAAAAAAVAAAAAAAAGPAAKLACPGTACFWRSFRPSGPWCMCCCFGIASCFEGMGAAVWSWFLVGSEGNVRQWSLLARRRFRPSVPWCFAVSESPARTSLWRAWELQFGAGFLSVQKATLGSGACLLGAASVLQCHGVLLFQNRPQATESVEKCCFSRISDDTLGSFLAWFWN